MINAPGPNAAIGCHMACVTFGWLKVVNDVPSARFMSCWINVSKFNRMSTLVAEQVRGSAYRAVTKDEALTIQDIRRCGVQPGDVHHSGVPTIRKIQHCE